VRQRIRARLCGSTLPTVLVRVCAILCSNFLTDYVFVTLHVNVSSSRIAEDVYGAAINEFCSAVGLDRIRVVQDAKGELDATVRVRVLCSYQMTRSNLISTWGGRGGGSDFEGSRGSWPTQSRSCGRRARPSSRWRWTVRSSFASQRLNPRRQRQSLKRQWEESVRHLRTHHGLRLEVALGCLRLHLVRPRLPIRWVAQQDLECNNNLCLHSVLECRHLARWEGLLEHRETLKRKRNEGHTLKSKHALFVKIIVNLKKK
jgi:hypothetical protein